MRKEQLEDLERRLRDLSHSEEAIRVVQAFSKSLRDTKARLELFNADHAWVRPAIEPEEAAALGFDTPDDSFRLLQGDIVSTNAAYFMGQRITGDPLYAVLNASCDLVPKRKSYASLLRITPIRAGDDSAKEKFHTLLTFSRRDSLYLPALPRDGADVIANAIQFDGICQIASDDLMLANRVASLSLVSWRVFGSMLKAAFARANPREFELRDRVERG